MKKLIKTKGLLKDNSGETIVEVTVAFTLLSIMLVVFSQGIAFASRAEVNASKSRNRADAAMIDLQQWLADPTGRGTPSKAVKMVNGNPDAYVQIYPITLGADTEDLSDDVTYYYAVYGTNTQRPAG